MAGKKTEKDLLSDFFGDDDLDWLDDDDAAAREAASAAGAAEEEPPAKEAAEADVDEEAAAASEPAAPPPPPPPVPRRQPQPTLPPQPAPDLSGEPVTPAPKRPLRPMPDQDPEETLVAAPSEPLAASFDTDGPVQPDDGRDPLDETIGAFLEPIDATDSGDPDVTETVTDDVPQSPLDDIVVEEDSPSELAAAQDGEGEGSEEAAAEEAASEDEGAEDPVEEAEAATEEASLDDTIVDGAPAMAAEDEAATEVDEAVDEGPTQLAEEPAEAVEEPAEEPAEEPVEEAVEEAAEAEEAADEAAATEENAGEVDESEEDSVDEAEAAAAAEGAAEAAAEDSAPEPIVVATWSPQDDSGTWAEVVTVLEAAAAERSGAERSHLLIEAARLRRDRLGDAEGARDRVAEAIANGADDAVVHEVRADVATALGDLATTVEALVARAAHLEGAAAAECYQAAAMIARHRMQELDVAETHLRSAIEADPTDYASLSLLRDQLTAKGREADRADVLAHISDTATGRVAAEAWWELGRLRHRLGDEDAAMEAYRAGRAADATHGPCFLAIQALAAASADDAALGELYLEESERGGPAEHAFWSLEAARAFVDARAKEQADAAFTKAVEAGHPLARREQQAWFLATDRPDAYADALAAEVATLSAEDGKAFALFRLGREREDAGQLDDALAAYQEAVELDPAAGPAAEAVARVLHAAGKHEQLLAFWQTRVEGSQDELLRRSVLLRMAEVAHTGLGDDQRSRELLERLIGEWPDDRTALHMLRRTCQRLKAWPEVADAYQRLAELEESPDQKAGHLARAGNVWRHEVGDNEKARECYGKALELRPAHVIALDEQVDLLEELGDYGAEAQVLRAAADALTDEGERVRAAYQAGLVYLDRLDDVERAAEAFQLCLRLQSDCLPALGMLKQIATRAGQGAEVYRLYLQQASTLQDEPSRHWRMLAAADLAAKLPGGDAGRDLGAILEADPTHPGAVVGQELRMLTMGAQVGLLNLYRRVLQGTESGPRRSALLVRVAHLFEALGDTAGVQAPLAEAITVESDAVPFRALARLAEGQRLWAEAAGALERTDDASDQLERARLMAQRLGRHDEALAVYADLLDNPEVRVGAALGAAALAQRAGDADLLLRAHATLAEHADAVPVQAAHALWSGQLAEASNKPDEALRLYRLTLSLRPASLTAFDGARRQLLAAQDADGLRELWTTCRPDDLHGLTLDLEMVGDKAGVAAVWEKAKEGTEPDLAVISRVEVARADVDDWRGVFAAVSERTPLVAEPMVKATAEAKRRWLLAEKLADTEEAWELYQRLHEEDPDDREVISALARIALARGETRMATSYLEMLAAGAEGDQEAADLRVRSAAVHRAAGETDEARQAYLDALDHLPDHGPALDGLKSLAIEQQDWPGLLATLTRESNLAEGEARVDLLVRIAETTADKLEDPQLTKEAWRKVLEEAPEHKEALEALTALCAEHEDWEGYVQHGTALAALLEGEERTALLARIGVVSADELGRDDAPAVMERALSEGPPNLVAVQRLEAFYRRAGDSTNTVRVLAIQADVVDDPKEKARLLGDAAQLEADVRGDRVDAARLYRKVLEADPDDLRALRYLSEYEWELGKRDDDVLSLFERLAPRAAEDLDLDDFDVAMELSTFHYRLASLYAARDQADEALAAADKALGYNASHRPTLELQAPLLVAKQDWKTANATLKRLLQLTGGQGDKNVMADIYAQLGQVEHALGHHGKATKRFVKALDLVPKHVIALKGQAALLLDQQQWNAALNVLNNLIYAAPDPSDVTAAYLIKGRVLDDNLNRPDKAAQHYERSLAYDANQPKVLLRLSELSLRREDFVEASSAARRGLKLARDGALRVDLLVAEAIAKDGQGQVDKAADALQEARALAESLELTEVVEELANTERAGTLHESLKARLPS